MKFLKGSFVAIFVLAAFYDWLTSFLGTLLLLNAQGWLVWGLALVVSLACLAINFATAEVWTQGGVILRVIWGVLFSYDLVTTAVGIGSIIEYGTFFDYSNFSDATYGLTQNFGVALPITFIVVISPVLAVWIMKNWNK